MAKKHVKRRSQDTSLGDRELKRQGTLGAPSESLKSRTLATRKAAAAACDRNPRLVPEGLTVGWHGGHGDSVAAPHETRTAPAPRSSPANSVPGNRAETYVTNPHTNVHGHFFHNDQSLATIQMSFSKSTNELWSVHPLGFLKLRVFLSPREVTGAASQESVERVLSTDRYVFSTDPTPKHDTFGRISQTALSHAKGCYDEVFSTRRVVTHLQFHK